MTEQIKDREMEVEPHNTSIELPGGRHVSVDRRRSINLQWVAILLAVLFQLYHFGQENGQLKSKLDSVERRVEQLENRLFLVGVEGRIKVEPSVNDSRSK